jgi:hypothetical protein
VKKNEDRKRNINKRKKGERQTVEEDRKMKRQKYKNLGKKICMYM